MRSMLASLALGGLLLVTGCSTDGASEPGGGQTSPSASACAAKGGELRKVGRLQSLQCVVPYADAGKACSAKTDCQGRCLYDPAGKVGEPSPQAGQAIGGRCEATDHTFGCITEVDGGVAKVTLCID